MHSNAWREKVVEGGAHEKLLQGIRLDQNRRFGDSVKHEPVKVRRLHNMAHSRTGHVIEWEDILIAHYGENWREKRDACENESTWKSTGAEFVRSICLKYGLPHPRNEARSAGGKDASSESVARETLPENQMTWPSIPWDNGSLRFVFIVDCQPLHRISCGVTPLLNDSYVPLFTRILDDIRDIFKEGFAPPRLVDDPVLWVDRGKNKMADYLCNVTMDRKKSWRKERSIDMPLDFNWFAVSDGGARPLCSACGWAVGICFVVDRLQKFEPLVVAGTYLEPRVNSFLAEALALEHATLEMKELMLRFR